MRPAIRISRSGTTNSKKNVIKQRLRMVMAELIGYAAIFAGVLLFATIF